MLWIDTSYTQVSQEENGGTQRVTALGIDLCVAREKKKKLPRPVTIFHKW